MRRLLRYIREYESGTESSPRADSKCIPSRSLRGKRGSGSFCHVAASEAGGSERRVVGRKTRRVGSGRGHPD